MSKQGNSDINKVKSYLESRQGIKGRGTLSGFHVGIINFYCVLIVKQNLKIF
jgi:hypothetical protein